MIFRSGGMVGVAQSVEHQVVALGAAGSSPVTHPIYLCYLSREKRPILFKFKVYKDFNHPGTICRTYGAGRHTLSILRIKI